MISKRGVVGMLMLLILSILAACGGGGGGGAGQPALVSIQVTPASVSKAVGLTQQYTAIGTYTAGPTQDITASVSWNSSNSGVAAVTARDRKSVV